MAPPRYNYPQKYTKKTKNKQGFKSLLSKYKKGKGKEELEAWKKVHNLDGSKKAGAPAVAVVLNKKKRKKKAQTSVKGKYAQGKTYYRTCSLHQSHCQAYVKRGKTSRRCRNCIGAKGLWSKGGKKLCGLHYKAYKSRGADKDDIFNVYTAMKGTRKKRKRRTPERMGEDLFTKLFAQDEAKKKKQKRKALWAEKFGFYY